MSMNVQAPKQTIVAQTLRVTTLKGPTCVAVLTDIRVTAKTARVSKFFLVSFVHFEFFFIINIFF